jgi:homoserine O-acetyltransferase
VLHDAVQHVAIYGDPKPDGSNVAFVAHALTGSARVEDWWTLLLANGAPLDLKRWSVIGINALGSCYGSTGPTSLAQDGRPYGARFPTVTVRDAVRAQALALDQLNIPRVELVVGASLGGMQTLQWALDYPERVGRSIIIGAHDHQTPMAVSLNALQREAIAIDPVRGLRIARKLAMLTYKSEELLRERHDRKRDRRGVDRFDVEGYLDHQANVFEARMDPHAYVSLTRTMDSQDVRAHADVAKAPPLLFVGISSDWLFRPEDIRTAVDHLNARGATATYRELQSNHGHDAFLAEPEQLASLLHDWTETS